jgi:protein phosphatase
VANREIARGEPRDSAWRRADARHLTQAIGPRAEDQVRPDIRLVNVEEDTLFLLCSDGLSDREFVDRRGADIMRPLLDAEADLGAGCHALVDAGNGANGHDNLTAVLVRVTGAAEAAPRSRVPTTERIVVLDPPPATG